MTDTGDCAKPWLVRGISLVAAALFAVAGPQIQPARAQGDDSELKAGSKVTLHAPGKITALAASFGGRLAVGTDDGRLSVWLSVAGSGGAQADPVTVSASSKRINALHFSPDAHLIATASDDGQVALWKIDNGALVRADHFAASQQRAAISLAFSTDGQTLVVGHEKGSVDVWGINATAPSRVIKRRDGDIKAVSFVPRETKEVSVVDSDMGLSKWNIDSGNQIDGDMDLKNSDEKKTSAFAPKPDYFNVAVSDDGSRFAVPAMRYSILQGGTRVDTHWVKAVRSDGTFKNIISSEVHTESNEGVPVALSQDGRLLAIAGVSQKTKSVLRVYDVRKAPEQVGEVQLDAGIRYFAFGPTATGYQIAAALGSDINIFPIDLSKTGQPTDTLAVLDLAGDDQGVADTIRSDSRLGERFVVLNPGNLKELIDEFNLSDTDMVDPKGKLQTGKICLSKKNLIGSVHKFGETYQINLQLIDKETTKQIWADQKTSPSGEPLLAAIRDLTKEMLTATKDQTALRDELVRPRASSLNGAQIQVAKRDNHAVAEGQSR